MIEKNYFKFYEYDLEAQFLNEKLKENYVLTKLENGDYHFVKNEIVKSGATYQIAFFFEKKDTDQLLKQYAAISVYEKKSERFGGYYYYILADQTLTLMDDRKTVLKNMKDRLQNFNLSILCLLLFFFLFKFSQSGHYSYLFFSVFNLVFIIYLVREIFKIRRLLKTTC